jgi:hypothetical protein
MSQRELLSELQSILEYVADSAARNGYGLMASLTGAAAEEARLQLAGYDFRQPETRATPAEREKSVKEDTFS